MSEFDDKKPTDTLSVPPPEDSWDLDEFASDKSAPPVSDVSISPYTLEPTFNTGATSRAPDSNPDVWETTRHPLMNQTAAASTGKAESGAPKSVAPAIAGDDWDLSEFDAAAAEAKAASLPPAVSRPVASIPPASPGLSEPPAIAMESRPPSLSIPPTASMSMPAGDDWDLGEFEGGTTPPVSAPPVAAAAKVISVPPAPSLVPDEPVAMGDDLADEEPVAMGAEEPAEMVSSGDDWSLDEFTGSTESSAPVAPVRPLVETPALDPSLEAAATGTVSVPPAAPVDPGALSVAPYIASGSAEDGGWDTDEFASGGTSAKAEPPAAPITAAPAARPESFDQILEVEDKDAYLDSTAAPDAWSVRSMRDVGETLASGTGQPASGPSSGPDAAARSALVTTGSEMVDAVLARLFAREPGDERDVQMAAVYVAACGLREPHDPKLLSEARRLIGEKSTPAAADLRARIAVLEESGSDELERLGSAVGGGALSRAPWISEALRRAVSEGADERAVRLAWALAEIDPAHPLARWVQAKHLPAERLAEAWDDYLKIPATAAAACERARLVADELKAGAKVPAERIAEVLSALGRIPESHVLHGSVQSLRAQILELQGDWAGWAEAMRRKAASLAGEERTTTLYRLARVLHEELGRLDEARDIYEELRSEDPRNVLVLKLLEDVERRTGRPRELMDVFGALYKTLADDQLKAITAVKAGQVADEMLKDPQAAIEWYSKALEVDPRNPFALSSIGRLFARAGEWQKLAQVYEFEAEGSPDRQQKIDFMLKHAELLADKLGQRKMAIEVLRTALLTDDSNLNIYRELGRLLYAEQQWEDLIRLYQAEATLTRDKSRLVAIYMSLGELWQKEFTPSEPVDKFAQAVENYYHALEVEPDYTPALRTLGRLFYTTANWDLLIKVFEREIELVEAAQAKAGICIKIAEICEDRKKDVPLAIENLRKALEFDPQNQMVINLLSRLAPTQKNWDDLVQVYIREAQMTKDPRYAAALHQLIGEIWRDHFQFDRKSNDSFSKAIELDPALITARRELEENREAQAPVPERIAALQKNLAAGPDVPAQAAGELVRLLAANPAEISDERLQAIPDAFAGRALLALQPLLDGRRLRALAERVASLGGDESSLARALLVELPGTDEIAETAYVETLLRDGNLGKADLERIYARVDSRKPSLGHWELKAALWDKLGRDAGNIDELIWEGIGLGGTSSRLLPLLVKRTEAGNANAGILEALRLAAAGAGDTAHELLAVEGLLALASGDAGKESLLELKARALAALPGRQQEALDAARELFKVSPDSAVAESLISRLSTELGRSDDARLFAERKLAKATTPAEQATAKAELARIAIELENNQTEGTRLLQEAVELDSGNIEVRRTVIRLHERQKNFSGLAEALEGLETLVEPAEKIQVRERLAALYGDELKVPERQLLHLEALARLDTGSPARWAALAKFHRTRSDWPELARSLIRQASATDETAQAERLMTEAARIAIERQLPEQDLETIYQWAKSSLERASDQQTVLGIAIDSARALDLAPELAGLLERRAASTTDEKKQVGDLIEAAKLYETVLDNKDKAQSLYATAAELDDTHPAALLAQAEKLFREEDYAKALPVIRKAFGAGIQRAEPRVRSDANYMMGVCMRQVGDAEQARGAFLRVLEDMPAHRDALLALAEFDGQKEDWNSFVQRLETVVRNAADESPSFRANLWTRIAHACEKAGKPDDALKAFESVVRENPSSEDALTAVVRVSTARGYLDRANTALDALAGQAEGLMENHKAGKFRLDIARNLDLHLGDPAKALVEYRRALDLDGSLPEALLKVAEAEFAGGNSPQAEELITRLVKQQRLDPKIQAAANAIMGKLALAKGDSAAAQTYLESAAQQGSDTSGTAEQMIALYEKNGEWDKASQALEKLIDSLRKDNPRASLPLLLRRAVILKDRLNKRDDAIMEIRRAIRLDPQNTEVHETLAGIFRENMATLGEAIKSYNAILQIDPFHARTYETLAAIHANDLDRRYCTGQSLSALGIATPDVTDFVAAQRTNQPIAPKTKFNPALGGKQFWHPACQHFLQEFLPQLAPAISRAYPMDFVKLGVKPDAMPAGMIPEPVKQVMEQIGPVEGLIFVRDNRRPLQMSVERGPKGPVVLIGDQLFETVTGSEAIFVAARTLFQLVDGTYSLARLDNETIHRLLALFARAVDENFKMGGDPAAIKRDVKTLDKEISRTLRKDLQAKLAKYREAHTRVVMPAWMEGMQCTRDRFGLVLCGDLQAALTRIAVRTGVIQQGPMPEPQTWPQTFKDRPQFGEMLRYSVSEEYFAQRRALGMSIDTI